MIETVKKALRLFEPSQRRFLPVLFLLMLVGSLFNEERQVAHALSRAAAILREKGREKEAADVMADLRKRFPDAPEAQ